MDEETSAAGERQHNLTLRKYDGAYDETDSSYTSSDAGPSNPGLRNELAAIFGGETRKPKGTGLGGDVSVEARTYTEESAQAESGMESTAGRFEDPAESPSQQEIGSMSRNEQRDTPCLEQGQVDQDEIRGMRGRSIDMAESTGVGNITSVTAVQPLKEAIAPHTLEDGSTPEDRASGLQKDREISNPGADSSIRDQDETFQLEEDAMAERNIAESDEEPSTFSWRGTAPSPGLENTNRRFVTFGSLPSAVEGSSHIPSRNVRDIVIPRWQLDAEVTFCPICRSQFSFFVRKHHCRRCGRVVCNACSPHRITIPYQYIVQPPAVHISSSSNPQSTLTINRRDTGFSSFAERNGGMKVRLCNPCVPDPNPLPPQPQFDDENSGVPTLYLRRGTRPYSYAGETVNSGSASRARGMSAASTLNARRPYAGTISIHSSGLPYRREQASRYPNYAPRTESLRVPGVALPSSRRSSHSTSPTHSNQFRGHGRNHQSLSFELGGAASNPQPHYRSLLDVGSEQYIRTTSPSNRPLPPVPPHNEEDECPVCHRVLFSRSQADFEERKAAHIMKCIDEQIAFHSGASNRPRAHTTHSTPVAASANQSISSSPQLDPPIPLHSVPNPSQIHTPLPASSIPTTPEVRAAAREQAHATVVFGQDHSAFATADAEADASHPAGSSSSNDFSPRRTTGMFVYHASEKDCVDDAECTICLEEFEVGAQMARLECFCRFHRKCIGDWFVDHPGRCPVHQHDGYGF